MKYLLTNEEMRKADEYTISTLNVPSLTLMERAGRALAQEAERVAPQGDILCVCGGGNNGGDGFVCARVLKTQGRDIDVLFFSEKISHDCQVNAGRWKEIGGNVFKKFPQKRYALIIDCLFGTGFKGELQAENALVVEKINACKEMGTKVLSADIPSGVCGENGFVQSLAVKADATVCIGEIKVGVLFNDGIDYAGEICRADIGINLPDQPQSYAFLIEKADVRKILPVRKRNSNKGSFGKAAIVAGSAQYTGAAFLSACACLRSGTGYTTLFVPEDILPHYILKSPEILLCPISKGANLIFQEENFRSLLAYSSIAYGMGMGVSSDVAEGLVYLLKNYGGKLIVDADGINSLAKYKKETLATIFAQKKCDVIITPHVKEFSRLSGFSVEEIKKDVLHKGKEFSEKHRITLLIKDAVSSLFSAEKTVVNATGNSGQAKGGSGDVLAGVIAGVCAMGLSTFESGIVSSYIVGKAAEIAAKGIGEYSLTATDLIAHLGAAFVDLFVAEDFNESGS